MMRSLRSVPIALLSALTLALAALPLAAQNSQAIVAAQLAADRELLAKESYITPPAEIVRLVTAPRHLNVTLTQPSPDRRHFLKEQSDGLPSVTTFGKPHYYLGGLQVDFKANRVRTLTTRGAVGLQLIDPVTGKTTAIDLPKNATASNPSWSPEGKQLAYIANFEDASQLYVADIATGKSTAIIKAPLLATLVNTIEWTADGKSVVAVLLPDGRKPEPKRPEVAVGPIVRLAMDPVKDPERNYASLLNDPYEADLLEYYTTGQLALIDVKTHTVKKIGPPTMIQSVDVSPDGLYFHVITMQRPFSYIVQYSSFGTADQLWDATGKVLSTISKRPLRLGNDTTGGGRGGRSSDSKRGLSWMPQGPGIFFLESVPGTRGADSTDSAGAVGRGGRAGSGAAGGATARPDRVVQWLPPFGPTDTKVLYESHAPISNLAFSDDAKWIFATATSGGFGEIYAVNVTEPTKKYSIVRQRSYTPSFVGGRGVRGGAAGGGGRGNADDTLTFYNNPGAMLLKRGTAGGSVAMVSQDGGVYLQGTQYYHDFLASAPREFIDKIDIKTGTKVRRVFESAADAAESIAAPLDDDFSRAIVNRETVSQVSDSYLRDMQSGTLTKLTNNKDYTPDFTGAIRKRVVVTRADGFQFVVKLTLPPDYKAGTRLPAMFWFYPYEYTEQAGYDRTLRTENVNRFPVGGPRTIEYLVTQGYAVANFDPPIVGEAGRMNDNYTSDLQMNLIAVIDELDKQGYIDRTRLGLGGHSYGAFSTVNAMTLTPYFKAGIAGDGMYNRTLTPTGFQSERRDLWSGQKTYLDMSPMLRADKLQGALLMYHSLEDQNVGTDPISSIRMMQALRAAGKTSALFMYPYEDHGPATKESDLDQWGRWTAWLDLYVKHAGENQVKKAAPPNVQP